MAPWGPAASTNGVPHAVQTTLAADNDGAPAVRVTPIVVGKASDNEELLAHPLGIGLQLQSGEEELALRCEVPLDEQDCAHSPGLTGY